LEELSPIRNLQETQKKCYETELLSLQTVLFAERIKGSNSWRIVLDGTPFFAESGGQVGDTGFLKNEHGVFRVDKTSLLTFEGKVWISHEGEFLQGHFQTGQGITAEVNEERRRKIASHHSATHLLQAALRQRLGSHVTQKGSLVEEHHLRFDFSHPKELSEEEKTDIENIVNAVIFSASPVELLECSQEEAHCLGALSFFGEKYGEKVRVVRMKKCKDYFSQELCGGTHVRNTGQIGGVKILSESGIAAGVRRIEAVAGPAFLEWVREVLKEKDETIVRLKCEQKKMARQLQKVESANAQKSAEITKEKCGEWWLIHQHLGELPAQQARECAQQQGASLSSGVLLITSLQEGHISLIVEVGAQDVDKISAHDLIQVACLPLQGQGGGKRHRAQGGSAHPEYFGKALDAVRAFLKECPN
jgi:alanyl-tRNA synthetase